jgi:hypothetical protein
MWRGGGGGLEPWMVGGTEVTYTTEAKEEELKVRWRRDIWTTTPVAEEESEWSQAEEEDATLRGTVMCYLDPCG